MIGPILKIRACWHVQMWAHTHALERMKVVGQSEVSVRPLYPV